MVFVIGSVHDQRYSCLNGLSYHFTFLPTPLSRKPLVGSLEL